MVSTTVSTLTRKFDDIVAHFTEAEGIFNAVPGNGNERDAVGRQMIIRFVKPHTYEQVYLQRITAEYIFENHLSCRAIQIVMNEGFRKNT